MSDPLKNASNFIEISDQPGQSVEEQVKLLRFALTELLRDAEEIRAGRPNMWCTGCGHDYAAHERNGGPCPPHGGSEQEVAIKNH